MLSAASFKLDLRDLAKRVKKLELKCEEDTLNAEILIKNCWRLGNRLERETAK